MVAKQLPSSVLLFKSNGIFRTKALDKSSTILLIGKKKQVVVQ